MAAETDSAEHSETGRPGHLALALARSGSRAVVLGTGTHDPARLRDVPEEDRLPDIPAVVATTSAVQEALLRYCGMDASQIRTVLDPDWPHAYLETAREMANQAEDVLLVYYTGHGLANVAGEFFLATSSTTNRDDMLPAEALRFTDLRKVLAASRARHVVLVLDCCLSGRASEVFGPAVADEFDLAGGQDGYLLTAASATGPALAPPGERYTAFTGAFLDFLRDGDPSAGAGLTLDDAYRYLAKVLPQRNAPAPRRRITGNPGVLVIAVNPKAPPVTRPRPDSSERVSDSAPARQCPYPGLDAFTEQNAEHFHGRERLVSELVGELAAGEGKPLAIVGRSGAGKSSLLRAGLLPAIKDGRLDVPGSRTWPQTVMTPGEHPLTELTRRLSGNPESGGRIVCVDQFEEIFTACENDAERRGFIRELFSPSGSASSAQVILGLRADFYSQCLEYPELAAVLEERQVLVHPMSTAELTSAIERPAAAVGLQLEAGLTGRLLHDLESAGGAGHGIGSALPMLAFTLQATWQRSDQQVLTLANYEDTGGIWGAVTQRADGVYDSLTEEGRGAARTLLLSMVRLGDGTDDVRRRVSVADLISRHPETEPSIRAALDAYVAARLVTVDNGTAEIAHEALLRAWPRLRDWISEDRQELLDRQRLAEAADLWKSGNGALYAGARLAEARNWLAGKDAGARRGLSPLERDFVRASSRVSRRRRSYVAATVLAVFLLILGGVYGFQQRSGNQQSQAVRSSVELAQEADSLRATDPAGAMWLSLSAYRSAATAQARSQLYESLTTPYPLTLPEPTRDASAVQSVAYSPDGATAAAVLADGAMRLWAVSDPLRPVLLATPHVRRGGITQLAFSPDSGLLAVHSLGSLQLWKVRGDRGRPALLSDTAIPDTRTADWLPVAFDPVGKTLAAGDADGDVRLWNIGDPVRPALLADVSASARPLNAVAFSPDGAILASASENVRSGASATGRVRLWDVRNPAKPAPRAALTVESAIAVQFSSVGHLLAASGMAGDLHVWKVANPGKPVQALDESDTHSPLYSVAFRPGSDTFLTADSSGLIDCWTNAKGAGFTRLEADGLPDPAGPDSVAFSQRGNSVLEGDLNGSVELWTSFAPVLPYPAERGAASLAWNEDGTLLLAQDPGSDNTIRLLDVSDPTRPELAATLPGQWTKGFFLPGGRTLATSDMADDAVRLWDVSNPSHPRAGAMLPAPLTVAVTKDWDASGNGLMLIPGKTGVRLWDIRNIGHPVLDSVLPVSSAGTAWFLGDRLAVIGAPGGLELWDISISGRPREIETLPHSDSDAQGIYIPSRDLLAVSDTDQGGPDREALWSLSGNRKPVQVAAGLDMDPKSLHELTADTWAALSATDDAITVWDTRDPRHPVPKVSLPVGSGNTGELAVAPVSGGWLVGTDYASPPDAESGSASGSVMASAMNLAEIRDGGRSIENYAQVPAQVGDFTLSPKGRSMATSLGTDNESDSTGNASDLNIFSSQDIHDDTIGILYPLDTDSLYARLCSDTAVEHPSSAWRRYLPSTYYRPACS